MFNEYHEIVTVKELCEMLRIGQNKAYELLIKREIPAIRMGRKYVIAKEHVVKYIRKNHHKTSGTFYNYPALAYYCVTTKGNDSKGD